MGRRRTRRDANPLKLPLLLPPNYTSGSDQRCRPSCSAHNEITRSPRRESHLLELLSRTTRSLSPLASSWPAISSRRKTPPKPTRPHPPFPQRPETPLQSPTRLPSPTPLGPPTRLRPGTTQLRRAPAPATLPSLSRRRRLNLQILPSRHSRLAPLGR